VAAQPREITGDRGDDQLTTAAGLERVCLLLADLSGYTAFLANSEPDHAPALAGDLVETVVRQLRPTFRLAKLEGDAAFLVAPLDRLDGPILLDAIDAAYDAFRRRMQSLTTATTCDCASCSRVPDLDLKFVAHAGSVVRHRVAGREELAGTDAIIAHRLLKADSPSAAGLARYVLFTDACIQALGLDAASLGMHPAIERFEHLGEVPVQLFDLDHRTATEGRPWTPPRRAPLAEAKLEIHAEPMVVWDLLTSPLLRPTWEGIERVEESALGGRRGVGTMSSCVADRLASIEEILEWRPYEAFVRQSSVAGIGRLATRYELSPDDDSTRLHVRWYGPAPAAELAATQRVNLDRLLVVLGGGTAEAGARPS
jgi:class 3 adenylate cyclase